MFHVNCQFPHHWKLNAPRSEIGLEPDNFEIIQQKALWIHRKTNQNQTLDKLLQLLKAFIRESHSRRGYKSSTLIVRQTIINGRATNARMTRNSKITR
ncbi:hypothetical protein H5410_018086 [Solanum commersonii]|uniref:Uncharacterized protein n=1 Tax=Solanum commersonii TaxID=4109 RepID=A0A9J6A0Y0_SOLCO|nr:hypothetical protein H5410_018086 [Solanum commersonii]